jgi:hypothetical protein
MLIANGIVWSARKPLVTSPTAGAWRLGGPERPLEDRRSDRRRLDGKNPMNHLDTPTGVESDVR